MSSALKDVRGLAAFTVVLCSMVGFVALTISGDDSAAKEMAAVFGVPALTFLFGLASKPITNN